MMRPFVSACALALLATLASNAAHAQRFEGIITIKVNAPVTGERGGGRAAGRGGEGRGANARVTEGRGAPGRGGEARIAEGRGNASRGNPELTDEQAAAMRSAFSGLQNIEYMTRRGRVRIGIGAAPGGQSPAAMIYVPDDGVMFTLLPAMSMYSETALADLAMATDGGMSAAPSAQAPRPPVVTHTKKFELVAGHKCEHVIIEFAKQKTDVCMGKGLGVFVMPAMMGSNGAWNRVMSEANGFPLKVIQANGSVSMEVTKIERKALPEALFNVPDTYTRMPDMLRRPPG
ncbi:MAG: DUF4412 domain-containing protein [Phycisphaerae bacterium]|nr:DUF4412 domain-containing protein [Gemmatimonadaceae bacterium]